MIPLENNSCFQDSHFLILPVEHILNIEYEETKKEDSQVPGTKRETESEPKEGADMKSPWGFETWKQVLEAGVLNSYSKTEDDVLVVYV